jgi:predicted outer membrane repeat protein
MNTNLHSSAAAIVPLLVGLLVALAPPLIAPGAVLAGSSVLFATPAAQGDGDCLSWANACTLQSALGVAASGAEIWVREGVHKPTANPGDRNALFSLKNDVEVYGGFAGIETDRGQRDWRSHSSILSGDIDGNDTDTNGNYIAETPSDIQGANSFHVVWNQNVGETAVLDGFVITAGQANGGGAHGFGAGMYNDNSSPTLTNVTFSGNSAGTNGGGIYNYASSPMLTNVAFSGNSASGGGGMYNHAGSSPTLTNVTFSGNSASAGGGMVNDTSSSPTLTNATFSGNTAGAVGGGIYNYDSSPTLTNVTFSGNSADSGGGINNYGSNSTFVNCILWGDSAPNGPEIYNTSSSPTITYSDVQACGGSGAGWQSDCGTDGGGNIDADPRFVDADGQDGIPGTIDDNLRLGAGSPAIDAGDNTAVPSGVTTDLDGKTRFVDISSVPDTGNGTPPIVDMGAYEVQRVLRVYLPLVLRSAP